MTGLSALIQIAGERGSAGPSDELERFLADHFPSLALAPPLFYSWPIGLRFDLGGNLEGEARIEQAVSRAFTLYDYFFATSDEAMIVGWLGPPFPIEAIHLFELIPGDAAVSFEPGGLDSSFEGDSELPLVQVNARVLAHDVDYQRILRSVVNRELGVEPQLPWDLFLLNLSRRFVYYPYDDRGLDVIAASREDLRDAYARFHEWLLDHERAAMDRAFAS